MSKSKVKTKTTVTPVMTYEQAAKAVSSLANPYTTQQERALTQPQHLGTSYWANYGDMTYKREDIEDVLNAGTEAAYAKQFAEQRIAEDNFYNQLASTAATQYAQARQDRGAAIMSGASAGARAANELSSLLGVSQASMEGLTELSQQRKNISDSKTAALSANTGTAMTTANELATQLAQLDESHYANMVNQYIADSDYNAQIQTNNANGQIAYGQDVATIIGQLLAANATNHSADMSADANRYAARQNRLGTENAASINAGATRYAANTSAAATRAAARMSAAAQLEAYRNQVNSPYNSSAYSSASSGLADTNFYNERYTSKKSASNKDGVYPWFYDANDKNGAVIRNHIANNRVPLYKYVSIR